MLTRRLVRPVRATGLRASSSSSVIPTRVKMVEVGARDGLQSELLPVSTADKVRLVDMLSGTGMPVIEATAFVSKRKVPMMADAEDVYTSIRKVPGVAYPVLTPTLGNLERALSCGVKEVAVFTAVSETFTQRNIGSTIEESFARFEPLVDRALQEGVAVRGYISCVAGCPYEGSVSQERVVEVAQRLYGMGIYEISLGDTIGIGNPGQVARLVRAVSAKVPHTALAAHFHDTYGQALSNILVAVQEGVMTVDSAVAGLGGCPYAKGASGNVATEEVIYMLAGLGIETGVDLERVIEAGCFISGVLKRETMSRVAGSILRRRSVSVPVRYREVLQAALSDGMIDPSERHFLTQHRLRHKVSDGALRRRSLIDGRRSLIDGRRSLIRPSPRPSLWPSPRRSPRPSSQTLHLQA